jgi:hypothetical protein
MESSDSPLKEAPALQGGATDDLEFPDWSGMQPHRTRVSNDDWLAYCRSNLPRLRSKPGYEQRRRRNGIPVEFVL